GAERGDDLGLGIELHAEAAPVIGRLGAAQAGNALRLRIAVGARLADGVLELLNDMRRCRQVGIAHAEVDDIGAVIARRGLGAIDHLEDVGRQAADAMKLFHVGLGAWSRCSLSAARRDSGFYHGLYHGLAAPPAVCAGAAPQLPAAALPLAGASAHSRLRSAMRLSVACLT